MKGIDLLSAKDQSNIHKKRGIILFLSGVISLLVLSVFSLNFFITYQTKQLNFNKNTLRSQIKSISFLIKKLQKEKKQFMQLKIVESCLNTNDAKIRKIVTLLSCFEKSAHSGFFIKNILYQAFFLSVHGSISSKKNFLKLIKKLEKKYTSIIHCEFQVSKNDLLEFNLIIPI